MAKGIYQFYWEMRRSSGIEGMFIVDSKDVAKMIGREIYFGEIAGKHSEVYGTIDEGDITLKTDDQDFIQRFEEILGEGWSTGVSPFDYLPDDWDADEYTGMGDDDLVYENLDQNN